MTANQKKKILRLTDGNLEEKGYDLKLAPGKYEKVHLLHQGPKAEVWLWRQRSDDRLFAVKSYDNEELDWQNDVPMERYILKEVLPPNPRIIKCQNFRILADGRLEMALEYYAGGDLGKLVRLAEDPLPENLLWHIFEQMANALALLHYGYSEDRPGQKPITWQPVVHGAVNPANIFCRQKYEPGGKFPSLVLGGFRLAFLGHPHKGGGGPSIFQPPEYPIVSAKSDVWGLGATIHALAHGQGTLVPIFKAERKELNSASSWEEREQLMDAWISNTKSRDVTALSLDYSEELAYCTERCLELERKERIDSRDLLDILKHERDCLEKRRAKLWQANEGLKRAVEKLNQANRKLEKASYKNRAATSRQTKEGLKQAEEKYMQAEEKWKEAKEEVERQEWKKLGRKR